ncbi:MAG: AAA family ATPase, partial [Rhodospirillaceae bacterium]|nr:AAA family ATPase [Rhodospirillaceae bacterium]
TVPLAVGGTGISATDYTLALSTASGLNEGVTLNVAAPHSAAQPAVTFTGTGTETEQVATLTLTALDDTADEGASETLTVGFGSGNRAVMSNLDRASGMGTAGTTPGGTVSLVITDNDTADAAHRTGLRAAQRSRLPPPRADLRGQTRRQGDAARSDRRGVRAQHPQLCKAMHLPGPAAGACLGGRSQGVDRYLATRHRDRHALGRGLARAHGRVRHPAGRLGHRRDHGRQGHRHLPRRGGAAQRAVECRDPARGHRVRAADIDRRELGGVWRHQAADLGFDATAPVAEAVEKSVSPEREMADRERSGIGGASPPASPDRSAGATRQTQLPLDGPDRAPDRDAAADAAPPSPAAEAVAWALAHLSEREAVFARTDLLAAALAHAPGAVAIGEAEREVAALEKAGTLHAVDLPGAEDSLATERTVAEERETVALWRAGEGRGRAAMRGWQVQGHLSRGPLTAGQKDAVKLILSAKDRTVGVQGYAGTGKTTMLNRARALAEKKGWRMAGLAPSASAAGTLATEAGIPTETLQRFLARNAGVAEGRLTRKGAREMRAAFAKTILVVDEGSLASTVQARDLLRIANALRIPRVVLVGDAKQLDAVDAGKPFAQLQAAGMKTATMDEIMRQRDPALKEAVEASLRGDIGRAFEKLGENVAEVKPDNIAGAVAARWLRLSNENPDRSNSPSPPPPLFGRGERRCRVPGLIRRVLVQAEGPRIEVRGRQR